MVTRFFNGVEDVAEFNHVPAPAAVTNIDAGARHIVNRTVPDGDPLGEVNFNPGGLFLHAASKVDQAIVHQAVRRIMVGFRSRGAVDLGQLVNLAVVEKHTAGCLRVANKTNPTGTRLGNLGSANDDAAVVIVHEYAIAAHLIQKAVRQRTILRAVEENRSAAINGPVRSHERFLRVHDRARCLAKNQSAQGNPFHRVLLVAAEFHQCPQPCGFHYSMLQIESGQRIEIQRVRFAIQEPFAGRIQLLENIFHETNFLVRRRAAVVLPAAFQCHLIVRVLAGNAPGEIAPPRRMHGVEIAARRI